MKGCFKKFFLHPLYRLIRRSVILSLLVAISIPFILFGARHAWIRTENRVEDWIPSSFEETKLLMRFIGVFGADELLMITWDGCNLDSPFLGEIRDALLATTQRGDENVVYFRAVLSGKEVYDQLRSEPTDLTHREAIDRMRGWLISPDEKTTCLIALVSDDGLRYRKEAISHVWNVVESVTKSRSEEIRIAGSTMDSVAIDNASQSDLLKLNVMSYVVCILISYICLRNLQATLLIFAMSIFNQQLCLAMIYYAGIPFDSVLMLAVNLTFVLSTSFGMYIVCYYRAAVGRFADGLAVNKAIRDTILPTIASATTTVLGLLSFVGSEMTPIRKFGYVSAFSVAVSAILVILFAGMHYILFPSRAWKKKTNRKSTAESSVDLWIAVILCRYLPGIVNRFYRQILLVAVILFTVGIVEMSNIKTLVGIRAMLHPASKAIRDYEWIESRIGPLIPVEVVIVTEAGDARRRFQDLKIINEFGKALKAELPENTIINALNFLPDLPVDGGAPRHVAQRAAYARLLFNRQKNLEETGYVKELDGKIYWRTTVRNYAMRSNDQGPFLDEVQRVSDSFLKSSDSGDGIIVDQFVCGGVPLVYRAQSQLLLDLQKSFLSAFVMIAVVLMITFRSIFQGLLVVFPNVLPIVVIFGILGWSGVRVEFGTMLTGSAALGIAVDGAIHYITWFRKGISQQMSPIDAVAFAYRRCGAAMVQTTAICSLGLLMFSFSQFPPTVYFSFFLFALLLSACIADLVVLPAILLSPLGRFFINPAKKSVSAAPSPTLS